MMGKIDEEGISYIQERKQAVRDGCRIHNRGYDDISSINEGNIIYSSSLAECRG